MGTKSTLTELRILRAFLDDPTGDHYGLEIIKTTGVSSGVLYPVLARFESRGWVRGVWEDVDEAKEGRRRRRYYRLSAEGERVARERLAELIADLQPPKTGAHKPAWRTA